MKKNLLYLTALCCALFNLSGCQSKNEPKQDNPIVKVTVAGKFVTSTKEDGTAKVIGTFTYFSAVKGQLHQADGTEATGYEFSIDYTTFPVTDTIGVKQVLDDTKIDDNKMYMIGKSLKAPDYDVVYKDGTDAATAMEELTKLDNQMGSALKGQGTQIILYYRIAIDEKGKVTVNKLS